MCWLCPGVGWASCWSAGEPWALLRVVGGLFVGLLLAGETEPSCQEDGSCQTPSLCQRGCGGLRGWDPQNIQSILIEGCFNWSLMLSVWTPVLNISQRCATYSRITELDTVWGYFILKWSALPELYRTSLTMFHWSSLLIIHVSSICRAVTFNYFTQLPLLLPW